MGHTRQTNLKSRGSVVLRQPSVVSDCETTVLHHHQPGHDAERLWVDKLQPRLEQLRSTLTQRPEEFVSHHSGVNLAAGSFRVCMLFDEYLVDASTYVVTDSDGGPIDSFRQSLVLTYLATADGTPPAGRSTRRTRRACAWIWVATTATSTRRSGLPRDRACTAWAWSRR